MTTKNKITKLAANWLFHQGEADDNLLPEYESAIWTPVKIPHSWNDVDTFIPSRGYFRGIGWYKTKFNVDLEMIEKKISVEFGAVYGFAEIWINGVFKGRYLSGYTGFIVDITKEIRLGNANLLAVRCGNQHDPEILPGREIPDYCLYGGIYREVQLVISNMTSFDWHGTTVQTVTASSDSANLRVNAKINGSAGKIRSVEVIIFDAHLNQTARCELDRISAAEYSNTIEIHDPMLWSPDTPNLYTAQFILHDADSEIMDCEETSFGIRTVKFGPQTGFMLNGKPLKLKGVNRHQCYPGLGNAVPASLQYEDALMIKKMGANFVRTSHYPQHEAFLDACDKLGLLIYAEIASWQTIAGDDFKRSACQMMKDMISRDINHPCIIIWGIMNEGRDYLFFQKMHGLVKSLDPYRDTAYAENKLEEGKKLGTISITDVLGINYQLDKIDAFHHDYPNYSVIIAEYANSCVPRKNTEGMINQLFHISEELNMIESRDFIAGSALWSFHDYGSDYEFAWPVQNSGVVDAYRMPKYTYRYLSARWQKTPQIYIAGHWTFPGDEGMDKQVVVISNCETVELFFNGSLLGKKKGQEIYVFNVAYAPGTIKASGSYSDGESENNIECQISTAGQAVKLKMEASKKQLPADNSEASILTVSVLDSDGNIVVNGDRPVDITMNENLGQLFGLGGSNCISTESGTGRIVFRSGINPGKVQLTAQCKDLKADTCEIELVEPSHNQDMSIHKQQEKNEDSYHKGQWNLI